MILESYGALGGQHDEFADFSERRRNSDVKEDLRGCGTTDGRGGPLMLTTIMKSNAIRVLAILALVAIPAFASPIFVNNFSFETGFVKTNSCAVGDATCGIDFTSTISGWTVTGAAGDPTVGLFQPGGPTGRFNTLSDGATSAISGGATISQMVTPTMVAGWTYVLRVDLGQRKDVPMDGTADLLICTNSNGTSCNGAVIATGTTPTAGSFGTFTATYLATAADAGKYITIELKSTGQQGNFDNVRLDSVPEPASFLLIGSALLGLSAFRRRRANS